jgi:ribosomal protein L7Ae-like RNA K-turn-binding protein
MQIENIIAIGFASKRCSIGYESCLQSIYQKNSKIIIVAQDAGNATKDKFSRLAEKKKIIYIELLTKNEIAAALKKSGVVSVVSIEDKNLANALIKEINEQR